MHPHRHRALAVLLACAAALPLPVAALEIRLASPAAPAASASALDTTAHQTVRLLIEPFAERRAGDPATLGQLERDGKPPEPVTTSDEVAAWVTDRVFATLEAAGLPAVDARQLARWGAKIVDPERPVLAVRGELLELSVVETRTLDAAVRLGVTIEGADGKRLWTGSATGHAGRSARSYKPEEHALTLSDALDEAIGQLLRSTSFVDALRGAAPTP